MGTPSTTAEPACAESGVGVANGVLEFAAVRAVAVDAVVLAALTAAAAGVYVWTKAPLYNPLGTIDPWLYTALWTNFDQIYPAFHGTYYVSRLPWILPGHALNGLFDPRSAALILHTTFFLAGGVLFYVLCRRWLGAVAAAIGYLSVIGSQMYFNAHRWDYQEGGVLTFMIATFAFALPRTRSPRVRAASLALAGAFAAAMVTTRIIDGVYLIGLPLLYFAVLVDLSWRARLMQFARDLAAFVIGALALLLVGGLFAKTHGEEFLFFMPQIRVVQTTSGGYNQTPVDQWLPSAPYFWVPPFAIVFAAVVLTFGPKRERLARRLLLASAIWLTLTFVPLALWQFLGHGWLFNLGYYFSSFLVPTMLCVASAVAVLVGVQGLSRRSILIVAVCALAILGPVIWIYEGDSFLRSASGYGDGAYIASFVAMGAAILLAILVRVPRGRMVGAAAATAALFAVAYGVDASGTTLAFGASDPRTGGLYDVGQKLIIYLRENGYEKKLPYFWYDVKEQAGAIGSVQSLYYYGYTYVDVAMPAINEMFRSRIVQLRPEGLVLLCADRQCEGGGSALQRAGYMPRLESETVLGSEGVRMWVKIYKITLPKPAS
jgi:hypothetical protein